MRATIAARRTSEHRWTHLSPADSQWAFRAATAGSHRRLPRLRRRLDARPPQDTSTPRGA